MLASQSTEKRRRVSIGRLASPIKPGVAFSRCDVSTPMAPHARSSMQTECFVWAQVD
jgi:hypothetical protein